MKSKLGCEAEHAFYRCEDCAYEEDPTSCAEYRRIYAAKIGFEIRG